MPPYDSLPLSLTCRITHQKDFAFQKNNGDIANRIRPKFLGEHHSKTAANLVKIELDDDGDISIGTDRCSLYVTADSVFAVGFLVTPKSLWEKSHINEIPPMLELLFEERRSLSPVLFHVRLYFRFPSKEGLGLLKSRCCDASLAVILGNDIPSDINRFRMSTKYDRNNFADSLELEGSTGDVQLRYNREAPATAFPSYGAFLEAADLSGLAEELRAFIEPLLT